MPPVFACTDDPKRRCDLLNSFVPDSLKKPYDMKTCGPVIKERLVLSTDRTKSVRAGE